MCSHCSSFSIGFCLILVCCCRSFYTKVDDYFPKEQVFQWDPRTNTLEELCAFLEISPCPKKGKESWQSQKGHSSGGIGYNPFLEMPFPLDTTFRILFGVHDLGIGCNFMYRDVLNHIESITGTGSVRPIFGYSETKLQKWWEPSLGTPRMTGI